MADMIRGNHRQRSKYLNGLRGKFKELVNSEGENTKDAKELHNEIVNLDAELKSIAQSTGTTFNNRKYS